MSMCTVVAEDDFEIAPGYSVADWKGLQLSDPNSSDWAKAIEIFRMRIRLRFIDPVDVLIAYEAEQTRGIFGFAILAIDCLLIETLQGFREGLSSHDGASKRLVRTFLSENLSGHFDDGNSAGSKSDLFYARCRCAIHHSGQTDGDFRVGRSGPLISFEMNNRVRLNRTAFHETIKSEFERYLKLLSDDSELKLRANFRNKMNSLCA